MLLLSAVVAAIPQLRLFPPRITRRKKSSRNEVTGHPATLMDIGASSLPSQYLTEVHGSEFLVSG